MSHFTVLVKITEKCLAEHEGAVEALEAMLAPYQENNMGDAPEEFLEFFDIEDENQEEYQTETAERFRSPDGEMFKPWDERFRVAGIGIGSDTHKTPEEPGWAEVQIPLNELYSTFEEYMADYCGYKERDNKTQRYGYWENPNAKWDWFVVGGRWRGQLKLKEKAAVGIMGKPGVNHLDFKTGEYKTNDEPGTADAAQLKELDWEAMNADATKEAGKFFDDLERFKKIEAGEIEKTKEDAWLDYDVSRKLAEFNLGGWKDTGKKGENDEPIRELEVKEFTREWFIEHYAWNWEFSTWAVVDEDGWHEKGKMGWWAFHDASANELEAWGRSFYDRFAKEEAPETLFVIVDCHI